MKDLEKLLFHWKTTFIDYLPKIFFAIVILSVTYFLAKYLRDFSLRFYTKVFKQKQSDVVKLISIGVFFSTLFFGIFLTLEVLGLEGVLSKVLAGAGIIGIIAGFAFKDIASNTFAGFLLNLQRPFKEDDWVEIDGNFGTINEIGWITTSLKTVTGQEVYIPNQLIYNTTFTNYSTFKKRRVVFTSGVSYGDDLDLVKRVALEEVDKIDAVLKNEVVDFYFTSIGSSTYNFEVRFWIQFKNQKDYLSAMNEIIMRIKKRFEKEDISLAYNVTTLDFGVKGGVNIFDKEIKTSK